MIILPAIVIRINAKLQIHYITHELKKAISQVREELGDFVFFGDLTYFFGLDAETLCSRVPLSIKKRVTNDY